MRLKYEVVFDNDERPSTSGTSETFENRFKPDGRKLVTNEGYFQSLEWTHSIGERMFYTIKGSHIIDIVKNRAFADINDPGYLPTFYLRRLQNSLFYTGGVDLNRVYRKTETLAGKFDLVAQVLNDHEVKFGLEVRSHELFLEDYNLQFRDENDPTADPSFTNVLVNGNVFTPFIPSVEGGYVSYTRHPLQMAAYVQDKIELFNSIILNLGVRYEYFDPDAAHNPAISEELSFQDTIFLQKNLQPASTRNMVSPRISVSYPITDRGTIRFSYGHFYQIGSLSSLYRNPNFRAPLGTTPRFGNPDVSPQRSIQYELGMQQGLTENLKIEVTGYSKDVSDYIFTQRIITARGDKQYRVLTNLNFANTRGISISMLKRRSANDILSASIDYTFQIAEGNRTEPEDEFFFSEEQGQPSETFLVPFSFDRSHTITSTVTLSQPNDWAASMIGWFRTGTPYTPDFPSDVVPIEFTQNIDRQVVQWNLDVKIEKFFQFGALDYSLFLQVDNVFDTENETDVYASSGRALFAINTAGLGEIRGRINRGDPGLVPVSALDNYYARPENVNQPRLVRIGASLFF
jgi:outer membrane receptor protein involved in Fe transport